MKEREREKDKKKMCRLCVNTCYIYEVKLGFVLCCVYKCVYILLYIKMKEMK